MSTPRTRRIMPVRGPGPSPIKRAECDMSYETTSSDQPEARLLDLPLTPSDTNINRDLPTIHENFQDEGPTPKRVRSSPLDSPLGSADFDYRSMKSLAQDNSSTGPRFIELTTLPVQNQAQQPDSLQGHFELVKFRAELSQLRLDLDVEKQQNEILRSQFEVERCLNEFLRGQTIAEQCVNKTLTAKVTALEERMNLQEPTFVTLQDLKQVLLTWLRDYLVNNRAGEQSRSQQ